jgi:hypothetical protein
MSETAMDPHTLLEALVDLAGHTQLEVRMLSAASAAVDYSPTGSTAGRVGDRVWVVLAPDDPPLHQAGVLAGALARYRADYLENNYVAPGVRDFIEGIEV